MRAFHAMEAYGPYGTVCLVDPLARSASGYVEIKRIGQQDAKTHTTTMRIYFLRDPMGGEQYNTPLLIQDILALVEEAVGLHADKRYPGGIIEIGDVKFYNNGVVSPHTRY